VGECLCRINELTKKEQMALFNEMKQDLLPEQPDKIKKLLKNIRGARFSSVLGCIHCGSTKTAIFIYCFFEKYEIYT
jgi:hypothetical protein